jgi:hypothetical protein
VLHGKRGAVELSVRVIACLAEGLGSRGTARGGAIDLNTVLQWRGEAAEQLQAFAPYFLCEVHVRQGPRDELDAVWRGGKAGEISAEQALKRLERSRSWGWLALAPVSNLLLVIETGPRPLAMAQRVGPHVGGVCAPGCVGPLGGAMACRALSPLLRGILAAGFTLRVARPKARGPRPAGCPCLGCGRRRSSNRTGVSAGAGCHTGWGAVRWQRLHRSYRWMAGR